MEWFQVIAISFKNKNVQNLSVLLFDDSLNLYTSKEKRIKNKCKKLGCRIE